MKPEVNGFELDMAEGEVVQTIVLNLKLPFSVLHSLRSVKTCSSFVFSFSKGHLTPVSLLRRSNAF